MGLASLPTSPRVTLTVEYGRDDEQAGQGKSFAQARMNMILDRLGEGAVAQPSNVNHNEHQKGGQLVVALTPLEGRWGSLTQQVEAAKELLKQLAGQ